MTLEGTKPARISSLDVLRAFAIVLVLLAHYPKTGTGLLVRVLNFGWCGVDLFFVLSGYLIGGQIFKPMAAGTPLSLGEFFLRRVTRTLPSYYAILAVYFFFLTPAPGFKYLLFTQNFGVPDTFAPSWSLCVEEQFYLLFPLAILALSWIFRRDAFLFAVPVLVAAEIAIRAFVWFHYRPDLLPEPQALQTYMGTLYYPTYCRLDGILLGAGLAAWKSFRPASWAWLTGRGNALLGTGAVSLLFAVAALWKHYSFFCSTVGFTFLNLAFACFTAAALSRTGWLGHVSIPGAEYVALRSYALYLTHSLAIAAVAANSRWFLAPLPTVAITALLALCFANLLYHAVERPSLRLRDRLLESRRSNPAASRQRATDIRRLTDANPLSGYEG